MSVSSKASYNFAQIGRYRVEREIGRGAMGVVHLAFDPVVERKVAIKTIQLAAADAPTLLELFKREARTIGRLEHPNIVTLYDAGESNELFYLVMQFVDGETLAQRMRRLPLNGPRELVSMFSQLLLALEYAHQRGVLHRDIKPSNIMIASDGSVKLTDFGIATLIGTTRTLSGVIAGTPSYMSPEQVLNRPLDARSDIFSVGCTLYEAIAGEKAFPGESSTSVMYRIVHDQPVTPTTLQPGADSALESVVMKALGKRADDRFQTCFEMANALEACLLKARATAAARPSQSESASMVQEKVPHQVRPVRRRHLTFTLSAVTTAIVVIAFGAVLARRTITSGRPFVSPQAAENAVKTTATPADSIPPSITGPSGPEQSTPVPSAKQQASPPQKTPARVPLKDFPGRPISKYVRPPDDKGPSEFVAPLPLDFNRLIVQGDVAFEQGQYDQSLTLYRKAHAANPANPLAKRKIALVLTMLGRVGDAGDDR